MAKKQKKADLRILTIKRAVLFAFGLSLFFISGKNWFLSLSSRHGASETRRIENSLQPLSDYPINYTDEKVPFLTARAVVVVDRDSAISIYQKNERTKLLPASTVKIMTALVAFDYYDLKDFLTVRETNGFGQDMGLIRGEKISVEGLLYGTLVASANDAAHALAQNYPGGEKAFVAAMNKKAEELNLEETHFANSTGLDSDGENRLLSDYSYTTALDLARLAAWALKNKTLAEMVATPKITVYDVTGRAQHRLDNINRLLVDLPGFKGVKTGWTEEAGECLVGYVERQGRGIITVILGSSDRFGETAKLVEWTFANYKWRTLTPSIREQ